MGQRRVHGGFPFTHKVTNIMKSSCCSMFITFVYISITATLAVNEAPYLEQSFSENFDAVPAFDFDESDDVMVQLPGVDSESTGLAAVYNSGGTSSGGTYSSGKKMDAEAKKIAAAQAEVDAANKEEQEAEGAVKKAEEQTANDKKTQKAKADAKYKAEKDCAQKKKDAKAAIAVVSKDAAKILKLKALVKKLKEKVKKKKAKKDAAVRAADANRAKARQAAADANVAVDHALSWIKSFGAKETPGKEVPKGAKASFTSGKAR